HALDLLKLLEHVFKRELVLQHLALKLLGLALVERFLRALDQRQHVAHAEDARRKTIRMKWLERVEFFAGCQVLDRDAGDFTHGDRRAAARVAVDFGRSEERRVGRESRYRVAAAHENRDDDRY